MDCVTATDATSPYPLDHLRESVKVLVNRDATLLKEAFDDRLVEDVGEICHRSLFNVVVMLGYDDDLDQFVRFERDLPDGKSETVIDVTAVAKKEGRPLDYDWTEVMLLGNKLNQDTVARPFENEQTEKAHVATSLYRRFYRLPEGVKLRLDACYHRFDNTRALTPIGQRYNKFARTESVRVDDMNLTIHFLHDPRVKDTSGLRMSSSNALGSSTTTCALIYKNEMYSVVTGNEWSSNASKGIHRHTARDKSGAEDLRTQPLRLAV